MSKSAGTSTTIQETSHHDDDSFKFSSVDNSSATSANVRASASSIFSSIRSSGIVADEYKKKIILSPASERAKSNKNIQELTINKLRVESVGLYGRSKEVECLQACMDRIILSSNITNKKKTTTATTVKKELVTISGYSGVGKSKLALELKERVHSTETGMFISGKFDQYQTNEPFSALSQAFGELCRYIMIMEASESSSEEKISIVKEIKNTLRLELQEEIHLLTRIIPDLDEIISYDDLKARTNYSMSDNVKSSLEAIQGRLKYAFRVFTHIMSSYFSPLVLCLDDLQWADVATLEIIELLVLDTTFDSPLLIVGCYRSNEVDENHTLSSMLRHISDVNMKNNSNIFGLTQIELGNLGMAEVNQTIMALLSIDDESQTMGLASICYKRTIGNPFFLIEFTKMLEEEGLLNFHLGILQWKWDESEIELKTASTENVVELLLTKMRKLSQEAQVFLQFIACLGSSFTIETVSMLWKQQIFCDSSSPTTDIDELLNIMIKQSYLEIVETEHVYRWVHDKIQEAALSLVSEESLASFRFKIGEIWYRELGNSCLEIFLFDAANLINASIGIINVDYAKLNLEAAEKAKDVGAFENCANYASKGINMLPKKNKWVSHSDVALKLYSIAAKAEAFLGHYDQVETYYNEVEHQKLISTLQKKDVYMARLDHLCNAELRYKDALDFCLNILKDLGCSFPRNSVAVAFQALSELTSTTKVAKQTSVEAYELLPIMTDPLKLVIFEFLVKLGYCAYVNKNSFLFVLVNTRGLKMIFSHGISGWSPPSLATNGMLIAHVLGDFDTAYYIGERALKMQEKDETRMHEAHSTLLLYTYTFAWVKPLQSCLKPFLAGYDAGMRAGDKTFAMWCLGHHHVWLPYMTGKSLKLIEEQCRASVSQMVELKEEDQALCAKSFWQLCLNLIGLSDDTVEFKGEAMDVEKVNFTNLSFSTMRLAKSVAYNYFGEFELGAQLAIEKGDEYLKTTGGSYLGMMDVFHRGLSLYAMARQNKKMKKKYLKHAKQLRKKLAVWMKKKNPNVAHYLRFLNAEHAAVEAKKNYHEVVSKFYQEAIMIAKRGGYVNDLALAHERYANFFFNNIGDTQETLYHMEEAMRCYTDWGAERKVELLRSRHKALCPEPSEIELVLVTDADS